MINTHGIIMSFGKHKGERITRVPRNYLTWMANLKDIDDEWRAIAKAELERRGGQMPTLEISGHAIDRASLRCMKKFEQTANKDEGLHAWMMRMAQEALDNGHEVKDRAGVFRHHGIQWVFEKGEEFPVLKSVMRRK